MGEQEILELVLLFIFAYFLLGIGRRQESP